DAAWREFEGDAVAGEHRLAPAQRLQPQQPPGAGQARRSRLDARCISARPAGRRMPAGGRQRPERASLLRGGIDMERLRIVDMPEGNNLVGREIDRAERDCRAFAEVGARVAVAYGAIRANIRLGLLWRAQL